MIIDKVPVFCADLSNKTFIAAFAAQTKQLPFQPNCQ